MPFENTERRVKILTKTSWNSLQDDINDYVSKNHVSIVDIKLHVQEYSYTNRDYTAVLIYEPNV